MFDGYILVGGKSSRMGTNKFALRLGDGTLSERAVAALQKIAAGRVTFITGTNQKEEIARLLPLDVPRIADVIPHKAVIGGIYTALIDTANEWTVILACDFPFVTGDLLMRLTEIAASVNKDISAVVPVQSDGRIQPLCAAYRTKICLKATETLVKSHGIPAARQLAESVKTRFVQFDELNDLRGAEFFFTNLNTQEEYLEAQNIFRARQTAVNTQK